MTSKRIRILGCMTGTSCDGADTACLEFNEQRQFTVVWKRSFSYPTSLRKRVLDLQGPAERSTLHDLLSLNRDLSRWMAKELIKVILSVPEPLRPQVIANHGQTVAHFPEESPYGTTLQLMCPTQIASLTHLTTLGHFRTGDLTVGGQGAPLVPIYHLALARRAGIKKSITIHNLGGISNLTVCFPSSEDLNEAPVAFDTGPANIWIDLAVSEMTQGKKKMDQNGRIARKGKIDSRAVHTILNHPFFSKSPPKSTGRDDFPFQFLKRHTRAKGPDLVATATEITAQSIARAYQRWIFPQTQLEAIYFCGGGARNSTLIERIKTLLNEQNSQSRPEIRPIETLGTSAQSLEAEAFAYLGYLSLQGRNLGGAWTGAESPQGSPGLIAPGKNWQEVLSKFQAKTAK